MTSADADKFTCAACLLSAAALGRMAGSLTGPRLRGAEGLVGVALVSAGLSIAATLILWTTRER